MLMRTYAQTDGQIENMMPSSEKLDGQRGGLKSPRVFRRIMRISALHVSGWYTNPIVACTTTST